MELIWLIIKGYLAIGIIFGIFSIFTSTSSGLKDFLKDHYEDWQWTWKDDVLCTLETVLLWPIIILALLRGNKDE
jgi:hypothetical protein